MVLGPPFLSSSSPLAITTLVSKSLRGFSAFTEKGVETPPHVKFIPVTPLPAALSGAFAVRRLSLLEPMPTQQDLDA
jgi:hypothetical protein